MFYPLHQWFEADPKQHIRGRFLSVQELVDVMERIRNEAWTPLNWQNHWITTTNVVDWNADTVRVQLVNNPGTVAWDGTGIHVVDGELTVEP